MCVWEGGGGLNPVSNFPHYYVILYRYLGLISKNQNCKSYLHSTIVHGYLEKGWVN